MSEHRHGAGFYVLQKPSNDSFLGAVSYDLGRQFLTVNSVAWTDAAGDPATVLQHFTKATNASQFAATARKKIARDREQREGIENVSFDWYYVWYRGRVYYTHDVSLTTPDTMMAADQAVREGGRFRPLDGAPRANRFVFLPSTKPLPGEPGESDSGTIAVVALLAAAGVGAAVVAKRVST